MLSPGLGGARATGDALSIQEALDLSQDGDVITLGAGTYTVNLQFPRKAITLRGDPGVPAEMVVLDGSVCDPLEEGYQWCSVVAFNWFDDGGLLEQAGARLENLTLTGGRGSEYSVSSTNLLTSDGSFGGGLWLWAANPTLRRVYVEGNSATVGGGAYVVGSAPYLEQVSVLGNEAPNGGGVYLKSSEARAIHLTVSGNLSAGHGAGLYSLESSCILSGAMVTDNNAKGDGGGLYLSYSQYVELQQLTVASNTAGRHGGGIYLAISTVVLRNSVVAGNSAVSGATILASDTYYPLTLESTVLHPEAGIYNVAAPQAPFNQDPEFLDQELGNFRLRSTSPVIDVGSEIGCLDPGTEDHNATCQDPDGSPPDPGGWGGPRADEWDVDGDGVAAQWWPSDGAGTAQVEHGYATAGFDCDDHDPERFPGAVEVCDGVDNNCDGATDEGFDQDGDGHQDEEACADRGGDDCDDGDPEINPGVVEKCNGVDDNCNGLLGSEEHDEDGDMAIECLECSTAGAFTCRDCDDRNPEVHSGAMENCGNGIDDNCDGLVDAQDEQVCGQQETPEPSPQGADVDADGFTGEQDCDDSDPHVFPGASELCGSSEDLNCDGLVGEMPCQQIGGGPGCSTGPGAVPDRPSTVGLALLLSLLGRARAKRGALTRCWVAVGCWLPVTAAMAGSPPSLDLVEPGLEPSSPFLATSTAHPSSAEWLQFGVVYAHANQPIQLIGADLPSVPLVSAVHGLDVSGAAWLSPHLHLGVGVPVSFTEVTEEGADLLDLDPGLGVGAVRAQLRYLLVERAAWALAASHTLRYSLGREKIAAAELRVAVEGELGSATLGIDLGYRAWSHPVTLGGFELGGGSALGRLGVVVPLSPEKAWLVGELHSTLHVGADAAIAPLAVEGLLSLRVAPNRRVGTSLGAGLGMTDGVATPRYRDFVRFDASVGAEGPLRFRDDQEGRSLLEESPARGGVTAGSSEGASHPGAKAERQAALPEACDEPTSPGQLAHELQQAHFEYAVGEVDSAIARLEGALSSLRCLSGPVYSGTHGFLLQTYAMALLSTGDERRATMAMRRSMGLNVNEAARDPGLDQAAVGLLLAVQEQMSLALPVTVRYAAANVPQVPACYIDGVELLPTSPLAGVSPGVHLVQIGISPGAFVGVWIEFPSSEEEVVLSLRGGDLVLSP